MDKTFNYESTETKQLGGGNKVVRKVTIKRGKGYKSITKFRKGKKIHSVKKPIHRHHLKMIKKGKFVVGLFNDCNKTRKNN